MTNRVWIEIDRPTSGEEGAERCDLLNKMLRKLGAESDRFGMTKHAKTSTLT